MKKIYSTLVALLAISHFSYAQWSTGSGTIYPTTLTDKVGIGTTNPSTPLNIIKTTEQFRLGYDIDNFTSFTTNSTGRLTIVSTGGSVNTTSRFGVGMMAGGSTNLSVNRDITGSATSYGTLVSGEIQSDVTAANIYSTSISTQATAFTLGDLIHYNTKQLAFGAGSIVNSQYGFWVQSSLTGATNNYGFFGSLAAAPGRWNLYMAGTANNSMRGNLGLGGISTPMAILHLAQNGATNSAAWGVASPVFQIQNNQAVTDNTTAAGATVSGVTAVSASIGRGGLTASNATAGSPVTYTSAASLYIANTPGGGANTIITNPYALYINAGNSYFGGKVGIGTKAPGSALSITGSGTGVSVAPGGGTYFGTLAFNREAETGAIFSATGNAFQINNGGTDANLHFQVYNGSGTLITSDALVINGSNGYIGIGTAIPDSKLTVKGNIHAEEVTVNLSVPGPDYVFLPGYKLSSLDELKAYVEKNHHLPEIPSAKQMAKQGINLSDMNVKLLKKVEELTLYAIQQKDENNKLKAEQQLTKQQQEARIAALEKALLKLAGDK
jgi:hypothetical protein